MAENAQLQAAAQAPPQYVFDPPENTLTARLPPRLTEQQRTDTGKTAGGVKQRGMLCARCHSTNTTFSGQRKLNIKIPSRKNANFHAQEWNCETAEAVQSEVPCVLCPVCMGENELQQRITHVCAQDNVERSIKPGKKCALCGWLANAKCLCPECNRVPHAKTFYALLNHDAPENASVAAQRIPNYVDGGIEATWYYMQKYQEYQKAETDARRTELIRRASGLIITSVLLVITVYY